MKILDVRSLAIPEVKVIRFARFTDHRGYFAEPFRRSDIDQHPDLRELSRLPIVQANESFSKPHVLRGLHYQWNPFMGKLVRTLSGHMVDLVVDIRVGSPTLGKGLMHDMPASNDANASEWIWVPPGFAHGNFFRTETLIEYFCTGEYSPGCEAGITPVASDIDWGLSPAEPRAWFAALTSDSRLALSDKDRGAVTLSGWLADPRSAEFVYGTV